MASWVEDTASTGVAFQFQARDHRGPYRLVILYDQQFLHFPEPDACTFITMVKHEPFPAHWTTSIRPPWRATICSTIESPMPVPTSPDASAPLVR